MKLRNIAFIAITFALLSGCAQTPQDTQKVDWKTHQTQLKSLTDYQAKGVFGFYSPEQRIQLTFNWKNHNDEYQLILIKMFKTVLNLNSKPNNVTLVDPDGKTYHGTDATQLVKEITGLQLPLSQMRDWLIGLPTGADTYQLNNNDQVAYLAKDINGQVWEMHYNTYNDQTPALPTQMILSQGELQVRIKISQWLAN
ncbi:lipoprotein insertase outer membrane protein LolB [Photobacterium leiognathi]|uniref:Outer-membrane lipoprotein LolB n=1 Tax=Photobacterium leiognathi subsp. mandapamensis TaxID=48408 RepID=A0A2T3L0X3_PHOLD|nr:lipoprotein insertase outer membrane protein LolB [Photobacterium leiognathi]PSV13997.1 outer membrane lipoprotein LolB [Photobacterium leiognathi subsp. mandapamensis]PSW49888.1 outer membrane lipoprotein LolB [Photobacterium leiognathi subsp. mandapamensis]PSW65714.1 outer membrane lipoprotein LolB [Photobacterium leiognathi subsp. mandapamensis]GAA03377.1 outer membrane lipoprotein LolB [Photobacterium leiognathi subsp. mandapamensis svers.1.1.]